MRKPNNEGREVLHTQRLGILPRKVKIHSPMIKVVEDFSAHRALRTKLCTLRSGQKTLCAAIFTPRYEHRALHIALCAPCFGFCYFAPQGSFERFSHFQGSPKCELIGADF